MRGHGGECFVTEQDEGGFRGHKSVPSHWDDNTIITIDEFGEMLGLTEDQLQEWSSRGRGASGGTDSKERAGCMYCR